MKKFTYSVGHTLRTRDGRRTGNAVITHISESALDAGVVDYTLETDFGNVIRIHGTAVLHKCFYPSYKRTPMGYDRWSKARMRKLVTSARRSQLARNRYLTTVVQTATGLEHAVIVVAAKASEVAATVNAKKCYRSWLVDTTSIQKLSGVALPGERVITRLPKL